MYFWLYGMTMFGYGIFVSAFFSKGKTAAIVATMLFYLTSFVSAVVAGTTVSSSSKTVASFFPAVGVQLAATNLIGFEAAGVGLGFGNASELYKNYRFGTVLWMNVLFFFVCLIAGLYLENVLPGAAGVRKSIWFPFQKSYWIQSEENTEEKKNNDIENQGSSKVGHSEDVEENHEGQREIDPENFEEIPDNLRRKEEDNEFLEVKNLRKRFDKGFLAINGLNASMYEDEIFALLGHNGAGKTTTINVLCGMLAASTGEAKIYGYDIKTQMKQIRKIMGICPQHNILFPQLTVREHLSIFADFKRTNSEGVKDEINQLLKDLNLENKQQVLSKNLSGGYKRKLSLGIALVGGSKVVFLDEPSSGMDVTARREMWDMLKKYRAGRIIILTTHYMEEADNLGDRIGIMSHGQMLCCGTSEFLKNKFGEGYNLVVVKDEREDNEELESFILNNVPGSTKVSEVSSEATFLLPKTASSHFSEFFKKFDRELKNLKASSYGVSMTTLEEVFLKVEGADHKENANLKEKIIKRRTSKIDERDIEVHGNYSIAKEQITGGWNIFTLHFAALFMKRVLLSKRNIKGFVMDLLLPMILIIGGFGLSTIQFFKDSDQRVLEPSLFPLPQRVIYNTNLVSGTDSSATLINLLAPSSAFSPTGVTSATTGSNADIFRTFDNQLFDAAQQDPLEPYRYGHYYFHTLNFGADQYKIVTFANSTSQDAVAAFPQFMYEAALKNSVDNSLVFTMVNDPMPIVQIYKDRSAGSNGFFIGFVLGIAFALVPTSIMMFLMNERCSQVLHQQIISGMNKLSYWAANFCFDEIKVYIVAIFAIIFFYIYDLQVSFGWLFLLLFPLAIVPYTYVTSFMFSDETSAQNFTIYHNFLIAGIGPVIFNILRLIPSTADIGDVLIWLPNFIPTYCLTCGLVSITLKDSIATVRGESSPGALDIDVGGGHFMFLVLNIFFWNILLVLLELGVFNFCRSKGKNIEEEEEELDSDVLKEQRHIENTSEDKLAVKADHIRKVFNGKVAVKDVCFGLEFGDCFALLVINGAGKTTTFKMLTNDVVPTRGEPYIVGKNVKYHFSEARKHIGYCPQFDAIFEILTVREHLEFYAKIKKIPKEYVSGLIENILKSMNLEQYVDKRSGTLSGGNKRKLSVAMAMLGNPPVVFLDEPSAGMDPKARRFMWEIIADISTRGKNSAVILTTHSMEEAEALSTGMGIMVAGQFKCFGSKQHIKNKFGTGYQVEVKFKSLRQDPVNQIISSKGIKDFLRNNYASCYKVHTIKGEDVIIANKEACHAILKDVLDNPKSVKEFDIEEHESMSIQDLVKWEYIIKNNMATIKALVEEFGVAMLLEQYAPRYRYRVPKGDKSVGYFFGFMEELQKKLDIDEYSVSQTTLEQIFNGFAREGDREVVVREFNKSNIEYESVSNLLEEDISKSTTPAMRQIQNLNAHPGNKYEQSESKVNSRERLSELEQNEEAKQ